VENAAIVGVDVEEAIRASVGFSIGSRLDTGTKGAAAALGGADFGTSMARPVAGLTMARPLRSLF